MAISLAVAKVSYEAYITGVRGLSLHTVEDYSRTLKRLLEFLGDVPLHSITTEDIESFIGHWRSKRVKPGGIVSRPSKPLSLKTLRNMQIGISAFWTWALKKGYVDNHIIQGKMRFIKAKKKTIIPYTDDEIDRLLKACESRSYMRRNKLIHQKRPTCKRDKALIYWLISTGTRATETISVRGPDVNLIDHSARILGKGNKEREVYFGNSTTDMLIDYLTDRGIWDHTSRKRLSLNIPDVPLFATQNESSMTRDNLLNMVYYLANKAGIQTATIHMFRHTFAKLSIRNGCSEEWLRRMLGHSTYHMVAIYIKLFKEDMQAIHRNVDPMDNFLKRR